MYLLKGDEGGFQSRHRHKKGFARVDSTEMVQRLNGTLQSVSASIVHNQRELHQWHAANTEQSAHVRTANACGSAEI